MKRYILYAGVNGAGKSTLYQTTNHREQMPRINTDEILRSIGDWRNEKDLMKAGKIAVKNLNEYLKQGISFNQETTLCGRSLLRIIEKARTDGYVVEMHYVGVETVDIAKERVAKRVSEGGHGIAEADIERRYEESFQNLVKILPIIDLLVLYDNTYNFRRFAILKKGRLSRISRNVPDWFEKKINININ